MVVQRVLVQKSLSRPLVCCVGLFLRFKSTTVPIRNATIKPQVGSNQVLQDFKNVFQGQGQEGSSVENKHLGLDLSSLRQSASLFSVLREKEMSEDGIIVSAEELRIISRTISQFKGKISKEDIHTVLHLSKENPQFLSLFEYIVKRDQTSTNSGILVSLYLQEGKVNEASEYVLELLENGLPINATTVELAVFASDLEVASNILHTAELRKIVINPRSLKRFLERAIDSESAKICISHYDYILSKTLVDKERLVKLMELIAEVGYLREINKIYKIIKNYDGTHPSSDIVSRFHSSQVKCSAEKHGLNKAFEKLAKLNQLSYSVKRYPEFLETIQLSAKTRKLERVVLHRLNYSMDIALKRFYLNVILVKLAQLDRIEEGLDLIIKHEKILKYIDLESIEVLTFSVDKSNSSENIRMLVQVQELKGKINVNRKKSLVDKMLDLVVNSDYWYKVFMVIENYSFEGYLMGPELSLKLKDRCMENALIHLYNDLKCVPEEHKETDEEEYLV